MLSNDSNRQNVGFGRKRNLEWHGCDLPVVQVFRRTSRVSALNLLPTNDPHPLRASPTMEAPVAGRVMADMFDDGSIFLASFVLFNMVQHSGISKHEGRHVIWEASF